MRHSEIAVAPPAARQHLSGMVSAPQNTERMQAHGDYLIEHQRRSGTRIRLCSTGCYSLYDNGGHHIGRTSAPGAYTGVDAIKLQAAAIRMAMSEELLNICRLVDADIEATGAVTGTTVDLARALLRTMAAV